MANSLRGYGRKLSLLLGGTCLLLFYTTFVTVDTAPAADSFLPGSITLREVPHSAYKELLDDELVFIDTLGTAWTAPYGTLTDGASVPRLALWVTDGRFAPEILKAAVIHDAYCGVANEDRAPLQYRRRPWRDVHRMFHEALVAGGAPATEAKIMFAAVWLGGPRWDDPTHQLEDVPAAVLYDEFLRCKRWIEQANPCLAEIENWMDRREPTLRLAPA